MFVDGASGFVEEFKEVLNKLSQVLNLQFEWVPSKYNFDLAAYVGFTVEETMSLDVFCHRPEAFGCANSSVDARTGEVIDSEILIYNPWPNLGVQFGDFDERHRDAIQVSDAP